MKFNLLALFALASSSVSLAQGPASEDSAISYGGAKLESVTTRTLCPMGAMCATNGTIATLNFEVPCAGGLVKPVTHLVTLPSLISDKYKVYVSGISYQTKTSLVARCIARSFETVEISLPNLYLTAENFVDLNN